MAEPSSAVLPGHLHSEHLGRPCGTGSQALPQHLDQGLHMRTPVQWSIVEETLGLKNPQTSVVSVVLGDLRCLLDSAFPPWGSCTQQFCPISILKAGFAQEWVWFI